MEDARTSLVQAAGQIDEVLRATAEFDYMHPPNRTTVEVPGPDGRVALLSFGAADPRRNVDPLEFSGQSTSCFCDWRQQPKPGESARSITPESWIFLRRDRAHQFAAQCGPEPTPGQFADLVELTHELAEPSLTVVNLMGSGASVPQHFHTQIYSLQPTSKRCAPLTENSLARLWRNVQLDPSTAHATNAGITITEVVAPVWGLQLSFGEDVPPRAVGAKLFDALQRDIRFRSQLALTYNLFLRNEGGSVPAEITVLFRESRLESVFRQPEVLTLVEQASDSATAKAISASDNRFWRWAWLECIGGLPARDDKFADVTAFDWTFWSQVWQALSLQPELRRVVRQRVATSLGA